MLADTNTKSSALAYAEHNRRKHYRRFRVYNCMSDPPSFLFV